MEMPKPEHREAQPESRPISEIEPIEEQVQVIATRAQIKELVEAPLVRACEIFWDKNIETVSSSASKKHHNEDGTCQPAHIILAFDSLSPENQQIAEEVCKVIDFWGRKAVSIKIPIESASVTEEDISRKAAAIAEKFRKQEMVWAPAYTIEEMREIYCLDPSDEKYGPDLFVETGWYYDKKGKRFYISEEHCRKATEQFDD